MRAVVAVLAPKTHAGSAFGLFWVGSKLTGFAASIGFGLVYGFTDRPRDGIIVIFVQLVAGWLATCQPEDRRGSANDRAILQGGAVYKNLYIPERGTHGHHQLHCGSCAACASDGSGVR